LVSYQIKLVEQTKIGFFPLAPVVGPWVSEPGGILVFALTKRGLPQGKFSAKISGLGLK
jgi:hypothetical protein